MGYKILAVDDEPYILQLLKDYFELEGYLVMTSKNGREAIEKASFGPDLILLDINMPEIDGIEVCKRIRDHVSCPIIFLTAKVTEQDRINGLMIGGDDYIIKPFNIDELGARVMAHLRRESRGAKKDMVKFVGGLTVNFNERCLYCEEDEIPLTKTEFDILEFLCMNRRQVFSKERIYENIRGYDSEGDSNIITEHIRRIRMKIAEHTEQNLIETVWGVGYKWIG
ncbi:MAG: response regulator transcription factor [Clostridiales bacterium]|nr:response regulator transcription factor [Clostridiales bacterium]